MFACPRTAMRLGLLLGVLIGGVCLVGLSAVVFSRGEPGRDPMARNDRPSPNPAPPLQRGLPPAPGPSPRRTTEPLPQAPSVARPPPETRPQPKRSLTDAEIEDVVNRLSQGSVSGIRGALGQLLAAQAAESHRAKLTAALLPLTKASNAFVKREAIRVLGVWGSAEAVDPLLKALATRSTFDRQEAIRALGQLQDARAAEPLAARLSDFFDHTHAIRALKEIGPAAAPAVVGQLKDKNPQVRIRALQVLEEIGARNELPIIKQHAAASHPGERSAAAQALERVAKRAEVDPESGNAH